MVHCTVQSVHMDCLSCFLPQKACPQVFSSLSFKGLMREPHAWPLHGSFVPDYGPLAAEAVP